MRPPLNSVDVRLRPLLTPRKQRIYRCFALAWLSAAIIFWAWWLRPGHILDPWLYLLATVPLLWIYGLQIFFLWVVLNARVSAAPEAAPGQFRVAMITTKTPAEPFQVVQPTLEAMLAQDFPHDTWLADEAPTPEVMSWCADHGVRISTRHGRADYHRPHWPRRTRCKEGNLAFFYDHWGYDDYDIVSQLDSDHVPSAGYLREMVRPFADPDVGYVTAPSICAANAAHHWAARTRLYAEAAFHGIFQCGYTGILAPMCIGSHYAVRTLALKEVGGLGPELAEDHSTTMLLNAGGWRGVHANQATAVGDGPSSVADLVTQEFQWSRSLLTLLLLHTPRYLGRLPPSLKGLFVFCQLWYPLFGLTFALLYVLPVVAILTDQRLAEVTYPAFVGHSFPVVVVMTLFAFRIRKDGHMRPRDAGIISWEKGFFVLMQWPWVLLGVATALYDWLTGRFVEFRITPKGTGAGQDLPVKVLAVYFALALGAVLPVLMVDNVMEAQGFYLLALLNAVAYAALLIIIIVHQHRESGGALGLRANASRIVATSVVVALVGTALVIRSPQSAKALATGLEPYRLARMEYRVSGAGSGGRDRVVLRFAPGWR